MKCTDNKSIWAKIGKIREIGLMAKHVILYGVGCFIQFINLNNGEEHHLLLNAHRINGDGVKCFRGHSSLHIFAYAENCQASNIYVKSYPDFQLIAKFVGGPKEGYKCLGFSDTSLLFSLGEMPNYTVTAWNWRSMEKFSECNNELLFENQIIRCSYGRPMYLAHLGLKSNKLFIWDVFTVCKTSTFSKHEVRIGKLEPAPFENIVWAQEGSALYIIDSMGRIYTVDRDFFLELVIDFSHECTILVTPSICWFMHGITVSGPNQEVRHYKKTGNNWICDWSYETDQKLYNIVGGKYEKCVAYTEESELICFENNPESIFSLKKNNSNFKNLCIVNPAGEFIVAICNKGDIIVYNIYTGELVSIFTYEKCISSLAENPELPCIAVGSTDGTLGLISIYNETKPSILVKLSLTDEPLTTTKFFEHGNLFCSGNLDSGDIFICKGVPGTQIEIVIYLQLKQQICDYMLVASKNMVRFFCLPVTHEKIYSGNTVIRYCIVDNQVVNIKEYQIDDNDMLYKGIIPKKGGNRDREFYLIPHNTRFFERATIERGSSVVYITELIRTGHLIKKFFMTQTYDYTITWGYDGFIFVRDLDFQTTFALSLSHHRYLQGVKMAVVNPFLTIIVSLGFDGVMAAIQLADAFEDNTKKQHIIDLKTSTKMALMFKRPTLGLFIEKRFIGKCWKEIQRLKNIEKDEENCRSEKNKLLKEFRDIKNTLQELVTENFQVPDNKKLDLLEFYLDTPLYNKKQQQNKEECRQLEIYLKNLILAQDKVSDYFKKNYWDTMGVQWLQLLGIFSAVKATTYCFLPHNVAQENRLKWVEEQRKVEQFLTSQDSFEPWVPHSREKLLEILARRPALPKEDYSGVAALRRLQDIEEMESNKSLETKIAHAGAVSQLYIDVSPGHYQQRQIATFYQCELQQAVTVNELLKLKTSYNRCFLNTRAIKEREMYNIKERNARLRHIVSEYNYFSDRKIYIDIIDPQWAQDENPETIFFVTDDEISLTPYVSPSEQALLDAKAAEEERIRQLLLADDFRERALQTMMNGVLEIKWEDELKRDVPKPKCLLEKQPEDYNEDDLRAIHDYDEKVAQLQTEREKYKSLLDVEFNKVATVQRDSIRKFNQKLFECTKYKFYVDQGCNQENLQVNRHRVNQMQRIETAVREKEILEDIATDENNLETILKTMAFMQEALGECRVNLETMQAKEKILEKAYRKDFMDMSPVVQEQAYKFYKKRPKASFRIITTATVLNELAKGVIMNEITFAMTQECLDFMKALEHLDLYTGVPPSIDEPTWALICRHRRFRIEFDIRLRANQIQILDGEATISTFQKRAAAKREKIQSLTTELEEVRAKRLHLIHNKQVQIVLRRGLVEIPLTGDIFSDFKDAVLVPKSEIEHVNKLIVEAGQLKLKTIEQNLKFRRRMMAAEWDHMRLRMQINDLIEQKKDIENVKFTKDMQMYLKNKSLGRKPEAESFELEIELLAAAYENRIKDKKDKYKKTKKQLNAYRESNKLLDKAIQEVNIDVCHFKLQKDWEVEVKEKEILKARMHAMLKRNQLVQKIQENHNEILVLQTELELLRLKTFPTFKYKVLDE